MTFEDKEKQLLCNALEDINCPRCPFTTDDDTDCGAICKKLGKRILNSY